MRLRAFASSFGVLEGGIAGAHLLVADCTGGHTLALVAADHAVANAALRDPREAAPNIAAARAIYTKFIIIKSNVITCI